MAASKEKSSRGRTGPSRSSGGAAVATPKSGREQKVYGAREVASAIKDIAQRVVDEFPDPSGLVVLGIRTHGVAIAQRIVELLEKSYKAKVGLGVLDITLYRDDLSTLGPQPEVRDSEIPFDITDANIVLVDDVLYTGRTIRAALDEIVDFGRPACIRLAALVDRGHREYPIQGDYVGLRLESAEDQRVFVRLKEFDDIDGVFVSTIPEGADVEGDDDSDE